MWKSVFSLLLASLGVVVVSTPANAKSIVYNGIECAASTDAEWVPSNAGLYGFNGVIAYCPILEQGSEGYTFTKLSYVMLYGMNITNPRLCRRTSTGSVTCGTKASVGSDAWILYKPAGGGQYDDAFLSVNVGAGVSIIKEYAVSWAD
jgi:hypothetical protein